MSEYLWKTVQEQVQQAVVDLLEQSDLPFQRPVYTSTHFEPGHFEIPEAEIERMRQAFQIYPSEQIKQPVYTPPIVDDAGQDIYNRVPEHVKQEIRDNIWRYLEQVQRDYPPKPRVGTT